MITEKDLIDKTNDFFNKYWNTLINGEPPFWGENWYFNGTIPNHDKRGCYALLSGKEIIYIGVGIGKSLEKYKGHGLGDRLKRYWQLSESKISGKKYEPTKEWVIKRLTSIKTIGFDEIHYPFATALEVYLINELRPPLNVIHVSKGIN